MNTGFSNPSARPFLNSSEFVTMISTFFNVYNSFLLKAIK